MHMPFALTIPTLGIYPKVIIRVVQKNIYLLFVITKSWKQPKCPKIGVWLNKFSEL